jgi:YfiH family protein
MSEPPFASLNIGLHVNDRPGPVIENRRRLCAALDVPLESLVVPQQVHGSQVVAVGGTHRGLGATDHALSIRGDDGLVTAEPGLALIAFSSDCPLIILYDPVRHAVGLIHAGWRGTVGRIAEAGVRSMVGMVGNRPGDLIACICPSIGPCCFEVRQDVLDAASGGGLPVDQLVVRRDGTTSFDLWKSNELQLRAAGLCEDHIICSRVCTACHTDLFFSHRREQGKTGRFAALVALRP